MRNCTYVSAFKHQIGSLQPDCQMESAHFSIEMPCCFAVQFSRTRHRHKTSAVAVGAEEHPWHRWMSLHTPTITAAPMGRMCVAQPLLIW